MKRVLLISAAFLMASPFASPSSAQRGAAPFVVPERNQGFSSLQEAVDAIGDRRGTILIAPGAYRQCAIQTSGQISFRAEEPGTVVFDGGICEEKATLVLRGNGASVDGLVFQNLRVRDGNGSGIRLEKSDLTVSNSMFLNSQQGILSHDDPNATLTIDRSTFSGLGRCDDANPCAHSIYIGNYGSLIVTNSRFERGRGGHYVKTRTARVLVEDTSFDDTRGQTTNYMIDLSNGSSGTIARNVFVQGRDKENYSAFITVAPEGKQHSSRGLVVANNTASFAPGVDRNSTFVGNWSKEPVQIVGNRLAAGMKMTDVR